MPECRGEGDGREVANQAPQRAQLSRPRLFRPRKVWKHFGNLIKNVSLEEGVARMAAWAKKAGARRGKPFEGIRSPQKSYAVMGSFGKRSSIRADKQCRSSRVAFVKNFF